MTRSMLLRELEGQLEIPDGSFSGRAVHRPGGRKGRDQMAKSQTLNDLLSLLGDRLTP